MKNLENIKVPEFITNFGEEAVETYITTRRILNKYHRRMGTCLPRHSSEDQLFKEVEIDGEKCYLPLSLTNAFGL